MTNKEKSTNWVWNVSIQHANFALACLARTEGTDLREREHLFPRTWARSGWTALCAALCQTLDSSLDQSCCIHCPPPPVSGRDREVAQVGVVDPADVHSVSGQRRSINEHPICAHNGFFLFLAGWEDLSTHSWISWHQNVAHEKSICGRRVEIHARLGRTAIYDVNIYKYIHKMQNILFVSGGFTVTGSQICPHVNSVSVVYRRISLLPLELNWHTVRNSVVTIVTCTPLTTLFELLRSHSFSSLV